MANFGSVTFSGEDTEYTFESTINLRQNYTHGDYWQLVGISITDPSTGEESRDYSVNHGSGEISIRMYAGVSDSPGGDATWGWYTGIVYATLSYRSEGVMDVRDYDFISNLKILAYPEFHYAMYGDTTYTINVYYGHLDGGNVIVNNSLTQHITFTVNNPSWLVQDFRLNFYPNQGTPSTSTSRIIDTITSRTSYSTIPYGVSIRFGTEGFTRDGYQLIGWDTNSSATTPTYFINQPYTFPAGSIGQSGYPPGNLYAIWQKVLSYVRINNTWKDIDKVYAVVGGANKEVDKVYVALNGQWKQLM